MFKIFRGPGRNNSSQFKNVLTDKVPSQAKKIQFKKSNDIDQKLFPPPSIVVAYIFPDKGTSPQFPRGGASSLKPSLVYLPWLLIFTY